jgi:hypothetical protein
MDRIFAALWSHRRALVALLLVIALAAPPPAHGQFGLDIGAIVAAINAIGTAISKVIGPGLSAINNALGILNNILGKILQFFQTVVYPQASINRAQQVVGILENVYAQILGITHINVASATLPVPQQLEQALLSRNPNNVPNVSADYQQLYQQVPNANNADPNMRNLIDITDAESQDAMKRSIEIDAIADVEMQAATTLNQNLAQAAPGTAPMIEAEAAAWLVRANAYTQSAFADAMRTRAIDLADRSAQIKFNAAQAAQMRQNVIDSVK